MSGTHPLRARSRHTSRGYSRCQLAPVQELLDPPAGRGGSARGRTGDSPPARRTATRSRRSAAPEPGRIPGARPSQASRSGRPARTRSPEWRRQPAAALPEPALCRLQGRPPRAGDGGVPRLPRGAAVRRAHAFRALTRLARPPAFLAPRPGSTLCRERAEPGWPRETRSGRPADVSCGVGRATQPPGAGHRCCEAGPARRQASGIPPCRLTVAPKGSVMTHMRPNGVSVAGISTVPPPSVTAMSAASTSDTMK